ncbi:MAG: hypothetical protein H6839_15220 [Planctomycetes bacterium]|nr:hypothetical protein [Planctomycetota bacterium]
MPYGINEMITGGWDLSYLETDEGAPEWLFMIRSVRLEDGEISYMEVVALSYDASLPTTPEKQTSFERPHVYGYAVGRDPVSIRFERWRLPDNVDARPGN